MSTYKPEEFKKFIETIETGQRGHWLDIAKALNVDKNTITAWRNTPEAQEAIQKGIDHALQCMQQAGARDWRMWETKLKMLGINPVSKVDVTSGDKPLPIMGAVHVSIDDSLRKDQEPQQED